MKLYLKYSMVLCFFILSLCVILKDQNSTDFVEYTRSNYIIDKNTDKHIVHQNNTRRFKILYWTTFYDKTNWYGLGSKPFMDCKYSNCYTVSNKSESLNSDAILIHMRDIQSVSNVPKMRYGYQKWIMFMKEAPVNSFIKYTPFNGLFNATMTYKSTSDIYIPSSIFIKKKTLNINSENVNYFKGKTRLIAWFASNCRTAGKREDYVRELQKYIHIDIYGKCGNLSCPRPPGQESSQYCDKQMGKTYKFYLAFENSLCKEYYTEKIARMYQLNVVPIVLGAVKYLNYFPPHSFINVRDFSSPYKLATYIKRVGEDELLYNQYFEWRTKYEERFIYPPCSLCEYLNQNKEQCKVVKRLDLFWNKFKDCYTPAQFYKGISDLSYRNTFENVRK